MSITVIPPRPKVADHPGRYGLVWSPAFVAWARLPGYGWRSVGSADSKAECKRRLDGDYAGRESIVLPMGQRPQEHK